MTIRSVSLLFLCVFFAAGCVHSISPAYSKSDAVEDPGLVGTWTSGKPDEKDDTVLIEKAVNEPYKVTMHDGKSGNDAVYETHLVKLNETSFADLLVVGFRHGTDEIELPIGVEPLHEIVKYKLNGDDLQFWGISGDQFESASKQTGFALQFKMTQEKHGDALLTSSTEQIREYLAAHPSEIFGEADHLKRKK
jgi:hypothetical protein